MKILLNFFSKRKNILVFLFFLALFIRLILIIKLPISQVFEYDPDEGYELIKSSLFLNGFSLYKEIWSDQPPLFTLILSYWFKLFRLSVYHGRILILIFSGMFLWAFYQMIKNLWGNFCAFVAVVFLILSTLFLQINISIMLCIPAFALAMLSIYYITLYRKSRLKHLLVLSGIFMALSLQTKLSTLFLMPLIVLEIVQTKKLSLKDEKQQKPLFYPLFLWFGSFLTVYLAITIIFFHFDFRMFIQQLFQPHLKKIAVPGCDFSIIWRMISTDYDIALLALMGIILLIRQKKWQLFFPVLWLVTALSILLNWRPVWDHYYLLISIPICWLAAISFSEFFRGDIRRGWFSRKNKYSSADIFLRWITAALIIITIGELPLKYYRMRQDVEAKGKVTSEERALLDLLLKYKPYTQWIVTDRKIFAFYTNILVPPELALITIKRSFTDNITQDYFIDKIQKYRPELILLSDFKDFPYYGSKVLSYIERNYTNIYQGKIPHRVWYGRTTRMKWFSHPMELSNEVSFPDFMWFANIKEFEKDRLPVNRGDHRIFFTVYKTPSTNINTKLYIHKDLIISP